MAGAFWSDHNEDLKSPEYARAYAAESIRIATIDALVNELDQAREAAGLSKAALARAIGAEPSVVRRLLSASAANPTVATIAEVAAALGMRVTLTPMSSEEQQAFTGRMLDEATTA